MRDIRTWTNKDSGTLYNIAGWSNDYFRINDAGHVEVTPSGSEGPTVDLFDLTLDLQRRGLGMPLLMRFSDILHSRVRALVGCFESAIREYGYRGRYRGVFPIKVNQQHQVIEELVRFGAPHGLGLEAGSKPELLAGLALLDNPDALLVLNGYKDVEYMETALLSQKLGRYPIVVIDRYRELELLLQVARRLGIRPHIGVRAKLTTKGAGKWMESTGDRSKFGLTATELVMLVEKLREAKMLDCLELLHFHIGSQISAVRAIKDAMQEAGRIYVELAKAGAGLKFMDAGGGLGVDYDGSSTNWASSTNYTMQEYANDVVAAIQEACETAGVPHPDILTESGRALVAHHSVLVFNILDVNEVLAGQAPPAVVADEPQVIRQLVETWRSVSRKNFQEAYHDALQLKEQATSLFNVGLLDLRGRARVEQLFWGCCEAILKIIRELEYVPDDLEGLEKGLADTYYGNFSVFQSVPDHWAVRQLFPTMPLHRLNERPARRGILADLTCDSDGKMDQFIELRDVKNALELHAFDGSPYYIGVFLVGAYQEILGDLHNLFGDTNAVHISLDEGGYRIDHVVEGDSVAEVLGYVQYQRHYLVQRVRQANEEALRRGLLTLEESALLMRRYEEGLSGYTYLEEEEPNLRLANGSSGLTAVSSQLHPVEHPEPKSPGKRKRATPAEEQESVGPRSRPRG
ncbi:MAG: arginine decarboxylase [Candidatus Eisenbacteria bacterium RBG_16_71_46]|nr:MAG: arginine decarboxylase [Candidatus Eisenbacteria bacterium RBG_16_71_46]OGF23715.1 MAG: arginine decarboxylase [Candidatus Eisenbacteria bacterium RBG_19FT_COMBO_70_11]